MENEPKLALEGINVLDLSRAPPGEFCTMTLGDLGAEVIKIEALVEKGHRSAGIPFSSGGDNEKREAACYAFNRNKRSIMLNLRSEEGRQVFCKLAEKADVIVDGFRPGVVKRLGVDYETIKRINPRIIYCAITGYGQSGPYQSIPGHDINYISMGGALGMIRDSAGHPVIPLNLIADYAGGTLHAVIGILAAIVARDKTGKGQFVDTAMVDGVISLMGMFAGNYFCYGTASKWGDSFVNGAFPYYNVYETKDGKYITIGCVEPWFWENLCREMGREDLIPCGFTSSHMFSKSEGGKWDEAFSYLKEFFLTKTRDEWFELLSQKDIPAGKVYAVDEVFSDPQVLHRQMVVEVDHPTEGKLKHIGIAVKLSETPGEIRRLPPASGEHTRDVLLDLGYTKEEIEELRHVGAIGWNP